MKNVFHPVILRYLITIITYVHKKVFGNGILKLLSGGNMKYDKRRVSVDTILYVKIRCSTWQYCSLFSNVWCTHVT